MYRYDLGKKPFADFAKADPVHASTNNVHSLELCKRLANLGALDCQNCILPVPATLWKTR